MALILSLKLSEKLFITVCGFERVNLLLLLICNNGVGIGGEGTFGVRAGLGLGLCR